jgi:hypothetical protein
LLWLGVVALRLDVRPFLFDLAIRLGPRHVLG